MISLHEETLALVKEERRLTGLIIENLQKISETKLFLEMGYSSLFQYCTKALGYSEASAYRRLEAVKVMKVVPEVKEKLNSGDLNLTTVAIAQNFFKTNRASVEEQRTALEKIEGCSRPETEKVLAAFFEVAPPKQTEKIHFHREGAALQIHLSDELLKKLDHIKSLRSHKNPNMSYAEVIADMCDIVIKKIDPSAKVNVKSVDTADLSEKVNSNRIDTENLNTNQPQSKQKVRKSPRYISVSLKSIIWQRDQGQCTYTDNKSGRRCNSKHLLQLDHDKPLFLGGETAQQNLRLLCHAHHRLRDREFNVF